MRIIDKIELVMKSKGITRYQIEKNLGIKQSTFKNWVNGTEPGVEKIVAILKYLELSADEIFELKEKEPNVLNEEETKIIEAYRGAAPAIQIATKKLLDIAEPGREKSSTSRTG